MQTQGKVMGHWAGEHDVTRCDCGPSSIVRKRYFYSMLLEWPDMAQDQAFHLGNIRRHVAEMHGFGTVCGLRVEKTQCHEQVRLKKGVAVDCLGREIRVECDVLVELHDAVNAAVERRRKRPKKEIEAAKQHHEDEDEDDDDCKEAVDVYLVLCYREI